MVKCRIKNFLVTILLGSQGQAAWKLNLPQALKALEYPEMGFSYPPSTAAPRKESQKLS